MSSPNLIPRHNIISHLVYAASGFNVSDVIINGRMLYHDRKFLTVDEEKIYDEVEKAKEELLQD
jgi:5-methylthioadenosine/S-adenosylhomocysteine deaminase